LLARIGEEAVNNPRVREDAPEFFTVASTVCEIFAAKECNSPQRCANPTPLNHLASATLRKSVKTYAKSLS
jgi:hypothetical protein